MLMRLEPLSPNYFQKDSPPPIVAIVTKPSTYELLRDTADTNHSKGYF